MPYIGFSLFWTDGQVKQSGTKKDSDQFLCGLRTGTLPRSCFIYSWVRRAGSHLQAKMTWETGLMAQTRRAGSLSQEGHGLALYHWRGSTNLWTNLCKSLTFHFPPCNMGTVKSWCEHRIWIMTTKGASIYPGALTQYN